MEVLLGHLDGRRRCVCLDIIMSGRCDFGSCVTLYCWISDVLVSTTYIYTHLCALSFGRIYASQPESVLSRTYPGRKAYSLCIP